MTGRSDPPAAASRPVLHPLATIAVVCGGLGFGVVALLARPALPAAWSVPGSAPLYLVGVLGTVLIAVPFAFSLAKRAGASSSPPAWFVAHVVCGGLGTGLLLLHSGLALTRAPALVLGGCVFLVGQGLWARLALPRGISATFGTHTAGFLEEPAGLRARARSLIEEKRALLAELDADADEALFSVTLRHWLRHPLRTRRYAALANAERRLLATHRNGSRFSPAWRALHIAVALGVALGVVTHVVTVTFFAGYVAGGGPIRWWHITAWGG